MDRSRQWHFLNRELQDDLQRLDIPCRINLPCSPSDLEEFVVRVDSSLSCQVPKQYLDLLLISDGLSCNGGDIYSAKLYSDLATHSEFYGEHSALGCKTQGFIERNLELRNRGGLHSNSLVFGDSDLYFFEWQPHSDLYCLVAKESVEASFFFKAFNDLLQQRLPSLIFEFIARGKKGGGRE